MASGPRFDPSFNLGHVGVVLAVAASVLSSAYFGGAADDIKRQIAAAQAQAERRVEAVQAQTSVLAQQVAVDGQRITALDALVRLQREDAANFRQDMRQAIDRLSTLLQQLPERGNAK